MTHEGFSPKPVDFEHLIFFDRLNFYQLEIAKFYKVAKLKNEPDPLLDKYPFVIIAATSNFVDSKEKLGISYHEEHGIFTPIWQDETLSLNEKNFNMFVLSKFAVIVSREARVLNNTLKHEIKMRNSKLGTTDYTLDMFRSETGQLYEDYDEALKAFTHSHRGDLMDQFENALAQKYEELTALAQSG